MSHYWNGEGVYTGKDGVDYRKGDKLPGDIDPATLESMISKGRVVTNRTVLMPVETTVDAGKQLADLQAQVATLQADLGAANGQVATLKEQLTDAQATITALSAPPVAPPAVPPAVPPAHVEAGPKKGK